MIFLGLNIIVMASAVSSSHVSLNSLICYCSLSSIKDLQLTIMNNKKKIQNNYESYLQGDLRVTF